MIEFVKSTQASREMMEGIKYLINHEISEYGLEDNLWGYIEPYNNCRETGFVLTLGGSVLDQSIPTLNIWAYLHRNTDRPTIAYDNTTFLNHGKFTEEAWKNSESFDTIDDAITYAVNLIKDNYMSKYILDGKTRYKVKLNVSYDLDCVDRCTMTLSKYILADNKEDAIGEAIQKCKGTYMEYKNLTCNAIGIDTYNANNGNWLHETLN